MTDIWFLHNRVRIPISGAATDGAFALLEVSGPPGDQPPLHVHHDHDEGFYVLEGELTLWVGDAVHVLRAGEGMLAPRGVPHTVRAGDARRPLAGDLDPGRVRGVRPRRRLADPEAACPTPPSWRASRPSTASRSSDRPGCCRASWRRGRRSSSSAGVCGAARPNCSSRERMCGAPVGASAPSGRSGCRRPPRNRQQSGTVHSEADPGAPRPALTPSPRCGSLRRAAPQTPRGRPST